MAAENPAEDLKHCSHWKTVSRSTKSGKIMKVVPLRGQTYWIFDQKNQKLSWRNPDSQSLGDTFKFNEYGKCKVDDPQGEAYLKYSASADQIVIMRIRKVRGAEEVVSETILRPLLPAKPSV